MNVYLAGPMRGRPQFNFPAFVAAGHWLRTQGLDVFNPAEQDIATHGYEPFLNSEHGDMADLDGIGFDLRATLGHDIAHICESADAVVVLEGWEDSKGACAEVAVARALGLPVMELRPMVESPFFYASWVPEDEGGGEG